MNKNTPAMNHIETLEMPEGIKNEQARLDAPEAEAVAQTAVVSQADTRSVVSTAEETAESVVPDAVKTDDPRREVEEKLASARARGVEWVRASDLLSRGTGRIAWTGIRLHQAAGTRTRRGLANGVRAVSKRVRELPPVSAFGRRSSTSSATARSGMGMR
jgi:hypothetical protein